MQCGEVRCVIFVFRSEKVLGNVSAQKIGRFERLSDSESDTKVQVRVKFEYVDVLFECTYLFIQKLKKLTFISKQKRLVTLHTISKAI